MRRQLTMVTVITAVLVAGTLTAPTTAGERPRDNRALRAVIEITCGYNGATITHDVGEAGPKGVTVRFSHPEGYWSMDWEGSLGNRTSGASAMVAEMDLPIVPGRARISCIPHHGAYRDPRWWVDAEVLDPRGHWRPTSLDCQSSVGTSWHGGRRPADQEEEVVRDALRRVVEVRQDDVLRRIGYPRQRPRVWGLHRDGLLIGSVHMMPPNPDGSVAPNFMAGCSRKTTPAR